MTVTYSASPLSRYLHQRRQAATRHGGPLPRLADPAIVPPSNNAPYLYVSRTGPHWVMSDTTGTPLTLTDLTHLALPSPHSPGTAIVVPDKGTATALAETVGGKLGRILTVSAATTSSRFLIATHILARKYYAPAGVNLDSYQAWATILSLPGGLAGLREVVALASEGLTWGEGLGGTPKWLQDVARQEFNMWEHAQSQTLPAECSRYGTIDTITAAWRYVEAADPYGRDEARTTGITFHGTVTGIRAGQVDLTIDGPFIAKTGRGLIQLGCFFTPPNRAVGLVKDIRATKSAPLLTLATPLHVGGLGDRITLIEQPHLPLFRGRVGHKWTQIQAPLARRSLPAGT